MKRMVLAVLFLFISCNLYAGQIIERKNFYSLYNPSGNTPVYSNAGDTATGDVAAVNTYSRKSMQINAVTNNEYIVITIEGRSLQQVNAPAWAVLDTVEFGAASADTSKNVIVDVTEYVDFIRVGIKQFGTDGNSQIDVEGLFTNLER